jgi:hypothetical protein
MLDGHQKGATRMRTILAAFLLFCVVGEPTVRAVNPPIRTEQLIEWCKVVVSGEYHSSPPGPDQYLKAEDYGFCLGYFQAFMERTLDTLPPQSRLLCLPDSVRTPELILVFIKYIENNPNQLHKPASTTLWDALVKAYPCTKS